MAKQKTFPAIPFEHWNTLRAQFSKSIPTSISANYLSSILGMTEASAKTNILPCLKQIGLIDNENKTNQDFAKKFRDDSSYPQFCQDILKKIYPQELLDAFPDENSSKEKIKNWIMNHTGNGDNAAGKIASFYLILLKADTSISSKNSNQAKSKERKPFKIVTKKNNSTQNKINHSETLEHIKHLKQLPQIAFNIQIILPENATPETYDAIFSSMSNHLIGRDE